MNVRFIKSATRQEEYPRSSLPKIAFAGKSNVGKSSLINHLVGRKNVARTSSTPGRTQIINFFNVDDQWIFVDLPGYGFAKVPAKIRARWAPMIEEFLTRDEHLRLTIMIVDVRHEPNERDLLLKEWLESYEIPHQVVATKVDKLSRSKLRKAIHHLEEILQCPVIAHSAKSGEGKKELWKTIESIDAKKT